MAQRIPVPQRTEKEGSLSNIEPALTAEEWGQQRFETEALAGEATAQIDEEGDVYVSPTTKDGAFFHGADRHALAALLLYGQTFGFTRSDVILLRHFAKDFPEEAQLGHNLRNLADRIEALSPPNPARTDA